MAQDCNRYLVPVETINVVDVIDRSRFLTTLGPASSLDAAKSFIDRVSAEYANANHNCYAYLVGPPGSRGTIGMSDAGEPHGTAGAPMLNVLLHCGVGDLVVVVTRYFGGIKLGRGGLVRAYSGCVQHVLDECRTTERICWKRVKLVIDYPLLEPIKRLYPDFEVVVMKEEFTERVTHSLKLPEERLKDFLAAATERSNGTLKADY